MARAGSGIIAPKQIIAISSAAAVAAQTTLMDWRKLGESFEVLLFWLKVDAGAVDAIFTFERSEDGATAEHEPFEVYCAQGKAKNQRYHGEVDLYYKLSARSSDGATSINVRHSLAGLSWRWK